MVYGADYTLPARVWGEVREVYGEKQRVVRVLNVFIVGNVVNFVNVVNVLSVVNVKSVVGVHRIVK